MPKSKSLFVCSECGYESAKWYGKCPGCGEWNTMNEQQVSAVSKKTGSGSSYSARVMKLTEIDGSIEKRIKTEKESLTDQTVTFSRLKNKHFARLASREEKLVQEIKSLESKSKQNEHKKILLSDQINEMQNDYEALLNRKEELQSIMEQCQSLIDSYSNYSSKYDTQNIQREVNDLIKDINLVDKKINTPISQNMIFIVFSINIALKLLIL